jgi:hypothetical protein
LACIAVAFGCQFITAFFFTECFNILAEIFSCDKQNVQEPQVAIKSADLNTIQPVEGKGSAINLQSIVLARKIAKKIEMNAKNNERNDSNVNQGANDYIVNNYTNFDTTEFDA